MDRPEAYFIDKQVVRLEDPFCDEDLILALGGGGEGTIGRLRGRQVVALDRRRSELEESPDGPIKVVGDAATLPFLDDSFDAVTAFFFLMYVPPEDQPPVLREAYRVLRPGGRFHIWDVRIPPQAGHEEPIFVVPLTIRLPLETVETGYGTRWDERTQDRSSIRALAEHAGFVPICENETGETFGLVLEKPKA